MTTGERHLPGHDATGLGELFRMAAAERAICAD
jgi:hypothetical protein